MGRSELTEESLGESRIMAIILGVVGLLTMVGGFAETTILGVTATGTVMMVAGVIGILAGGMIHFNLRLKRLEQQRIEAP